MSVSGYIDSLFYRLAVEHAIIGRIHIAAVVRPENTARMMIGIETFVAVVIGNAVLYFVHRYDFGGLGSAAHTVSACLEAGTVSCFVGHAAWPVTVVKSPALFYHDGLSGVDEVEAVVAVPPRAATSEYVTAAVVVGVSAESVYITAFAAVRNGIIVIVSVTVQYKIAGPLYQIEADSHTVVHGQVFIDVVIAAPVAETFRLGVSHNGNLRTHHFDILEMQVGTADIEYADTFSGGLYVREVEHRTFARVAEIADAMLIVRSAFVHQEYAGVDVFFLSLLDD